MEFSRSAVLLCAIALLSASASAQVAPANPFLGQLQAGVAGASGNGTGVSFFIDNCSNEVHLSAQFG